MTQKQTYTEELKIEVIAALASGMTQRQAAAQFNIPLGTIATLSAGARNVTLVHKNKQVIGAKAFTYIAASLDTLTAQVQRFGSDEFLSNPNHTAQAQGLAILHGVLADKLIRFFEAYQGDDDDDI
jgi:hypothetical protein